MKGTPNQVKGTAYQPAAQSKPPRGMPGIGLAVPQLPAPRPATMPPARAGGMTGDLMQQAAKKKAMGPAYPDPDHAPKPQAMGGAGVPSLGLVPQQQAQPQQQLDPLKQAAAQKMAGSAWNGTAPQMGGGKVSFAGQQQTQQPQQAAPGSGPVQFFGTAGGQGQDPNAPKASGGGPGLPPLQQFPGTQPGTGGLPGQGGNPASYGGGTNPNPIPTGPNTSDETQGQYLDPNDPLNSKLTPGQSGAGPGGVMGPGTSGGGYTLPVVTGEDTTGTRLDTTGQDGQWVNGRWMPANKSAAPVNPSQDVGTSPTDPDGWKGGDSEDWFAKYMKGSIQGDKFGPGDEWVKQQGDSIALDAEKQAAADKMKSQSMYGAAGLGGSGMAVGGMGQIDSAKNAAVTSAKADLAGQQAKLGIQDKIAQLNTQMALAKQKGDVALQEKLATDLLQFQQKESLLNMIENAPEKALSYIDAKSFADSTQHAAMMKDLKAAYDSGDPSAVLSVLMKMGKNGDGKATYGTGLTNKSPEEQAKLNQEFEAWWADYSKKMQDLGYDPGPKDFDKWYAEKHPGE